MSEAACTGLSTCHPSFDIDGFVDALAELYAQLWSEGRLGKDSEEDEDE